MWDFVIDALTDTIRLLPFLFLTYLALEFLEHKAGEKTEQWIKKAGILDPVIGGVAGAVPQCGFSAAASGLYAERVISLGTLIAIFLSTSDEMLPIMLSEKAPLGLILRIIGLKIVTGIFAGLLTDML